MLTGNSEILKVSSLIFMNGQNQLQRSAGILIRFIATIIRVTVRVRVRLGLVTSGLTILGLTQPRVRAKFRLGVLRWHGHLSAKVTKNANLGYSHDRGLS